jgi:hypothetical protein
METNFRVVKKVIYIDSYDDVITLNPFGDIHRDSPSCDVDRWKWWLAKRKKEHTQHSYYLGMGDYQDFASTSESIILKNPKLHEDTKTAFDDMAMKKNRFLANELKFAKGNFIGLVEGNHNWLMLNGETSTTDLANRLDTENLGWLCHISLQVRLRYPSGTFKPLQLVHIVACHGKAGGKTHGITINQVADLKQIFPVADIYIMGHDHQRGAWPNSYLVPYTNYNDEVLLKQKRYFLCRSGAFLKGYSDNKSTYSVKSLYRPSDLGTIQLKIAFHRDREDGDRIITDIEAII